MQSILPPFLGHHAPILLKSHPGAPTKGLISPSRPAAGAQLRPQPTSASQVPSPGAQGDSGTVTSLSQGQSKHLQIGFLFLIFFFNYFII